ncbi:MAG: transposase [Acidobacteria bacterium]|nr:transposase [Acidobacteriota bacterium]
MPNTGPAQRKENDQLQPWVDFYNLHRPHASLNQMPPSSRLGNGTTS